MRHWYRSGGGFVQLKFFWRTEPIDIVDVPSIEDDATATFVSVSAPMQLARSPADVVEQELVILDAEGRHYFLAVEVTPHASDRYPAINGYVSRTPRVLH